MEQYLDTCFTNQFQFDLSQSSSNNTQFDFEHHGWTSVEDKLTNLFDFEQDGRTSLDEYFSTQYGFDFENDDGSTSLDEYFSTQYGFDFQHDDGCTSLEDYFSKQFDGSCSTLTSCNNQFQLDLNSNQSQSILEPGRNSTSKIPIMLFLYRETMRYHKTPEQLSQGKDQLTRELLFNSMEHLTEYNEQELSDIKRLKNHIEAIDQMEICGEVEASIDDIDEMIIF